MCESFLFLTYVNTKFSDIGHDSFCLRSYVLASYARFLWDVEEDDEEEENEGKHDHEIDHNHSSQPAFFHGAPLTA